MADKESFKNPKITTIPSVDQEGVIHRIDSRSAVLFRDFREKDWDMEVIFTRKVKPIPVGTLVVRPGGAVIYLKLKNEWVYMEDDALNVDEFAERATNQTDEWYRINTLPLKTSSWDEVDKS